MASASRITPISKWLVEETLKINEYGRVLRKVGNTSENILLKVGDSENLRVDNLWVYVPARGLNIYDLVTNTPGKHHLIVTDDEDFGRGYVSELSLKADSSFGHTYMSNVPELLKYPFYDLMSSARILYKVINGERNILSNCKFGEGIHPFLSSRNKELTI